MHYGGFGCYDPCYPSYGYCGYGGGFYGGGLRGGFAIIVVLFILLIIIGACWAGPK